MTDLTLFKMFRFWFRKILKSARKLNITFFLQTKFTWMLYLSMFLIPIMWILNLNLKTTLPQNFNLILFILNILKVCFLIKSCISFQKSQFCSRSFLVNMIKETFLSKKSHCDIDICTLNKIYWFNLTKYMEKNTFANILNR